MTQYHSSNVELKEKVEPRRNVSRVSYIYPLERRANVGMFGAVQIIDNRTKRVTRFKNFSRFIITKQANEFSCPVYLQYTGLCDETSSSSS